MALLPLLRLRLGELTALLGSRSRALATLRWLHAPGPAPTQWPSTLPGVGAAALAELIQRCSLPTFRVVQRERANDGTTKLAVELEGHTVESVLIPSLTRSTVCLSSQSGCSRKCRFCATATLGFGRNLRAEEMLAQYLAARAEAPPDRPVRNVVFMGMGEPLDNLDEVLRAVELLTQPPAPQLGLEQVTVSTSGVLPGMVRFLAECRASLALSLNATTDGQRAELMPQTLQWPISALLGADLLQEKPFHEDAIALHRVRALRGLQRLGLRCPAVGRAAARGERSGEPHSPQPVLRERAAAAHPRAGAKVSAGGGGGSKALSGALAARGRDFCGLRPARPPLGRDRQLTPPAEQQLVSPRRWAIQAHLRWRPPSPTRQPQTTN